MDHSPIHHSTTPFYSIAIPYPNGNIMKSLLAEVFGLVKTDDVFNGCLKRNTGNFLPVLPAVV